MTQVDWTLVEETKTDWIKLEGMELEGVKVNETEVQPTDVERMKVQGTIPRLEAQRVKISAQCQGLRLSSHIPGNLIGPW